MRNPQAPHDIVDEVKRGPAFSTAAAHVDLRDLGVTPRVKFERPRLDRLREAGLQAVDMHFHTNHSDAFTTVRAALSLAKKKGVGLAITDHNTPSGALEALRSKPEGLLIPGMEISAEDGPHVLLYFYDVAEMEAFYRREIEKHKGRSPYLATSLSTVDLLEAAGGYNCVRTAAHPYGYLFFNKGVAKSVEKGYVEERALASFQAIEVLNSGMDRIVNLRAVDLATRRRLGITGGSDGHLLRDLGRVVTYAQSRDVEGFLDDIVHGRSFVMGREKNILTKTATATLLTTRFLPYTIPSLAVHYRQNMPRVRRFLRRKFGRRAAPRPKGKGGEP